MLATLSLRTKTTLCCAASLLAFPVHASADTSAAEAIPPSAEEKPAQEIIVTAERIRGSVDTEVPPIDELSADEIEGLGASSVADILTAVAPQAGSGRGRGAGGPPVILLNGQRIGSFRELRDLPPEAIRRVQIFPEELALKYGFRPDQRVVNFILKDNFASFSVETDLALPQDGGFSRKEFETTFTRIGKDNRLNIDFEFESQSRITEDERDIVSSETAAPFALQGNVLSAISGASISPALNALVGRPVTIAAVPGTPTLAGFATTANQPASGNIGEFRTLLPSSQRYSANATWSKVLGPQSNFSLNGRLESEDQQSLLGLPFASLAVPASNAANPFGTDVVVNRYFENPRPLNRERTTQTAQTGFSLNLPVAGWRWALTGDYTLIDSETLTQTNGDFTALRSGITAGTVNPFASTLGNDLLFTAPDTADSSSGTLSMRSTFAGELFDWQAGTAQITLRNGFDRQTIDSVAVRRGIVTSADLTRENINSAFNLELPLVDRGVGVLGGIGRLSVNGNMGFTDLSDFGTLIEYGAGLRWQPADNLSFTASIIGDENAPSLGQLGNPLIVTPNVAVFDFTRNESRFIEVVTGGNPGLQAESRRDLKLGVDWSPKFVESLSLQFEYFRNRSDNTTSAFPILTPEIEAAFPGRVTRAANGQLLRLDQRAVNFDQERGQRIRWGFNISGALGAQPSPGGFGRPGTAAPAGARPQAAAAPAGARPQGAGAPTGGTRPMGMGGPGGGRGGMMMGGMGGPPSRWSIALYHTYRIQEEILIRPGVPVLDLLDGSATSNLGGAPRHELSLNGGLFHKGMGLRFEGSYRGSTRADGSGLPGSTDLYFSDQMAMNLFLFVSLDQRGNLTKKLPWLKGSRIAVRVENLFDDYVKVRDAAGNQPLSYQRGFLDPQGRVVELSFRKRF
ncbi:hypothetical protein MCEREM21A_00487 [Sphingomonadaceae bacterium]